MISLSVPSTFAYDAGQCRLSLTVQRSRVRSGYLKHSAVFNVSYKKCIFGAFASVNYTGKVEGAPQAPENTYDFPKRNAVAFANSGVSFEINRSRCAWSSTMYLTPSRHIRRLPKGGAVSCFRGIPGRYFRAGASVKF